MVSKGTRTRPICRVRYTRRYEWALRMEQLIRRGVYFEPKVADITDDGKVTTVYELTIRGLTPDQVRKIFEDKLPSNDFNDPSTLFRFNALNEQEKKPKELLIDKRVATDIDRIVEKAPKDAAWTDILYGGKELSSCAKQVIADVSGGSVNDSTDTLTKKLLFGKGENNG